MGSVQRPIRTHRLTCLLPYRPSALTSPSPRTHLPPHTHPTSNQQTRAASTPRRHRKLLNIPPASFMGGPQQPTGSSGRSRTAKLERPHGSHIIFNPPPSAPNVYHTPLKFLPRDDPRRAQLVQQHAAAAAAASPGSAAGAGAPGGGAADTATHKQEPAAQAQALPPPVRAPYAKQYHITPAQVEEMRALRQSDENKWTRTRLAERFNCSRLFVGLVVQASDERVAAHERRKEEALAAFGPRKQKARLDRRKRKEMWKFEV